MKHRRESCPPLLRSTLALMACLNLGFAWVGQADEIVYDNTQKDYNNLFFPSKLEYGDEIRLGGTARTLTEFQFEYLGDFVPEQVATVTVRIYANDGVNPSPTGDFASPGTLLFQSEPERICPGYNVLAFKDLSVAISNSITWTVKFEGLTGAYNNRAGLTHYDAPTIGSSYDDFWMNTSSGWKTFTFYGNPPANFAARVIAAPETTLQVLTATARANGTHVLQLQGPGYRSALLEVATNETNWTTVKPVLFKGKKLTLEDNVPREETPQYRLSATPIPVLLLSAGRPDDAGRQTLRASGIPSHGFIVEAAWDMASWFPIWTNDFVSVDSDFKDATSVNFGRRYYRAYYVRDVSTAMGNVSFMTNNETLVKASGPPGRDCIIEYTKNFSSWIPLATNVFSFSTKTIALVDPGTTNMSQRFYRIRVAP